MKRRNTVYAVLRKLGYDGISTFPYLEFEVVKGRVSRQAFLTTDLQNKSNQHPQYKSISRGTNYIPPLYAYDTVLRSAKQHEQAAKRKIKALQKVKDNFDPKKWLGTAIDPKNNRYQLSGAWRGVFQGQSAMMASDGYRIHAVYDPDEKLGAFIEYPDTGEYFDGKGVDLSYYTNLITTGKVDIPLKELMQGLAPCLAMKGRYLRITVAEDRVELYAKGEYDRLHQYGETTTTLPATYPKPLKSNETWGMTVDITYLREVLLGMKGYETVRFAPAKENAVLVITTDRQIAIIMSVRVRT